MTKKNGKKIKFKKGIFQKLFWFLSLFFILVICFYFGLRYLVISKIYNSNSMMAYEYVIDNFTSEDGFFKDDDVYIFRGLVDNNYIQYGNLLFRIVKIYKDGSMEIILDEGINSLFFNDKYDNYIDSDIHKYLNDKFLDLFDKKDLNKSVICKDIVNDVKEITCNEVDYSSYVKLLMIGDYINSFYEGETYIGNEGEYYWLGNVSDNKVWNTDGVNLSLSDVKKGYKIKPVVTLVNSVKYLGGIGSKDDPIVIKKRGVGLNSYVKIQDDMYVVIDRENNYLKLMMIEGSPFVRDVYSDKLLNKLNDKYYNSLSYKKLLVKYSVNIAEYKKSYTDIKDKKKSVYIGLATISDFKFGVSDYDYLLVNKMNDENIYYYNNGLYSSSLDLARKIRPVIMIKSNNISGGSGTSIDPYIVEVK